MLCGSETLATGTSSTTWQSFHASFTADANVIKFEATTSTSSQFCNFDQVFLREKGKFMYQPDGDGEFSVGFLKYDRMRIAALSIFTAPDRPALTEEQAIVTQNDVAPGRAIRGYTGSGQGSIGDLQYLAGQGGSDYDIDDVERVTRRCLLQSGHPRGLSTQESSSYENIRGGNNSYFRVVPRNLTGKTSGNVSTIPCLYGYCQGASISSAYVKYTALTSGDTWTYEITSDAPALWGDMTTLDVAATGDFLKIEVKAPPNGTIVLRSYSLWEDSYDS